MAFNLSNPVIPYIAAAGNWFKVTLSNGAVYQLTMTSEVTVEESSKITEHKVLDRTVVSDNSVAYNRKISYNGIVTSVERLDQENYKTPTEYLKELSDARKLKLFAECELDGEVEPIENCLIERLSYTKGKLEGLTSWRVNLSLKEIRVSEGAGVTTIPAPSLNGATDAVENIGNASTRSNPLTQTIPALGIGGG